MNINVYTHLTRIAYLKKHSLATNTNDRKKQILENKMKTQQENPKTGLPIIVTFIHDY